MDFIILGFTPEQIAAAEEKMRESQYLERLYLLMYPQVRVGDDHGYQAGYVCSVLN